MTHTPTERSTGDNNTINARVSVLMPCFNVAKTLPETLRSLETQTLREFEIIAVDDGSTDDTLHILRSWADRDDRIHVLPRPHEGIIPALNAGIKICRSNLIARMDADDLAFPERLARQADFLDKNDHLALASCLVEGFPRESVGKGYQIYIEWLNSLVNPDDIAREIFIESPMAHPSVMIRKSWLERMGGYKEMGWAEDYDLWLRLHTAGARFGKVPQVLVGWREHPQRLTRTDSRYSVENFLRAKAHYLMQGPLAGRDALFVWGAGQMGRRLSKHLDRAGAPLTAFIDIDPAKIGREKRNRPIIAVPNLPDWWKRYKNPVLLAAVGSRGARDLIREQLNQFSLVEGRDYWATA
jgi:glycosyltransferase involved in cell wall biosynthesis